MTQAPPQPATITLDGKVIPFKAGQTVIQAAIDAGLYVPYLCYWPGMKPYGACRMCVVEVEGQRGTPASCTLPCAPGMRVNSKTPPLEGLRKGILELLLSEHPHGCLTCHRIELCGPTDICLRHAAVTDRCVVCPKNERCELKDTVRFAGVNLESPLAYHYRNLQIETRDPFYDRDYNLCIVCARCTRVCDELRGDDAISMVERAGKVLVGTSRGTSLLESGCEFCGACIDVCPVGALVERKPKWAKAEKKVTSVCNLCPVGCQVKLEVDRLGRVIRTVGDWDSPANHGQLCFQGKFGTDFVNHRDRLTKPLVRKHGALVESTWEEALGIVAERLAGYKGGGYALLASPRSSNEDLHIAKKFAREVMGSGNVDLALDTRSELVAPLAKSLGQAAATGTFWDLERAGCVLVVNSNVTEEHNVAAVPLKRGHRQNGVKLLVLDPREVELTRYADVWLRPRPGSEGVVLAGMLRAVLEAGLEDKAFLAERADGLDQLRASLARYTPEHVAQASGITPEQLAKAAQLFAASKPGAILYALDNIPADQREAVASVLVDLALVTGNVGKPSSGLFPLRPGGNVQGAQDLGFAPSASGVGTAGLVEAIQAGRVKALQVLGDTALYADEVLHALTNLDFLVVHDLFLSGVAQQADVVLPMAAFTEADGTTTSLERRVQRMREATGPKGASHPAWAALTDLARRMGAQGFTYADASAVFSEAASAAPHYNGLSHQALDGNGGVQWPMTPSGGTSNLYQNGFPAGRARLLPVEVAAAPPWNNAAFPFLYTPGRVLAQPHRDVTVLRGKGLNQVQREEHVELYPEDAAAAGIGEGDRVELVAPGTRVIGRAALSGRMQGVVSVTMLFGQLATVLQASEAHDPMLRVPPLDVLPARVQKVVQ